MNVSLKDLTHLFAQSRDYAIEYDDRVIPLFAEDVKVCRSSDYMEFAVGQLLVTIAMTTGYIEHCRSIESLSTRMATTIFTPYRVERRHLLSNSALIGGLSAQMVIQRIPKGVTLTKYLEEGIDELKIAKLYGAIEYLEETLLAAGISFSNLSGDDLIVGEDGLLYPFRYHKLRYNKGRYIGFDRLRRWMEGRYSVVKQRSIAPVMTYPNREEYEGHLYVGKLHEDRVVVEDPTGFGYVDSSNTPVIPSQYLWADSFREGRAEVQTADGFGLIDIDGGVVIPAIYDSLGYNPDTGITVARKGAKWAYFSYRGEQLTPFVEEYPDEEICLRELQATSSLLWSL